MNPRTCLTSTALALSLLALWGCKEPQQEEQNVKEISSDSVHGDATMPIPTRAAAKGRGLYLIVPNATADAKPIVPDPGQTITIFNPQGKPVGVTRTAEAFQELQKALGANDEQGLTELTSSGQAYLVPSGTQAKFLDYGDGWSAPYEVRILGGEHAGERAFVYHRSVTK